MSSGGDVPPVDKLGFGDVIFMNRKCLSMKDPLGIGLCLFTKTENRFDHVGLVLKISDKDFRSFPVAGQHAKERSPSGTYVLETNTRGVTLYTAEKRISQSSSHEIAKRSVVVGEANAAAMKQRMLRELESMYSVPYQSNVLEVIPSVLSPPDKMDRMDAVRKIVELEHQRNNMKKRLASASVSSDRNFLTVVDEAFEKTQLFLLRTYFPHIQKDATDFPSIDWGEGHFYIDGKNQSTSMVCSEFISNLWQRCGLTIGFVPSSSNRPFDLLDDERFNFLVHGVHFGDLSLVKGTARIVDAHWKSDAKTKECSPPLDDPIAYLNAIRAEAGAPQVTSLAELKQHLPIIPETYAVQSSAFKSTLSDLYIRAAGVGVLFSVTSFLFTPLNFLSVEQQLGVFLVRGNMWSFGFGMFAKNLVFTTAQCLFLFAVTRRAAKQHHSSVVMKTDAPCESAVADLRHPYYEVVRSVAASCVVGHLVSCPVSNWVLYYHFGRQHPGPLPLRLLMRGGLLLTPFCLFLPLQASWVYWYETVGSLIIPTRSSIFRPREDLLQKEYWPHYRMDALFGAAAATLGIDLCRYAVATRVRRSFLKDVYYPSAVPSFGRRKFLPGYRFRLAANAGIFTISASILHLYTLL